MYVQDLYLVRDFIQPIVQLMYYSLSTQNVSSQNAYSTLIADWAKVQGLFVSISTLENQIVNFELQLDFVYFVNLVCIFFDNLLPMYVKLSTFLKFYLSIVKFYLNRALFLVIVSFVLFSFFLNTTFSTRQKSAYTAYKL